MRRRASGKSIFMASSTALALFMVAGVFGCGSSGTNSSNADANTTANPVWLKLSQCIAQWNQDGQPDFARPSEEGVLVTTDPEGECIVAFDQFAGGSDGSLGAWAWVRSPQGEWDVYISSESSDIKARVLEAESWEEQREQAPNAYVVSDPSHLAFDGGARIPPGAKAMPSLVTNPAAASCHSTVNFTGGTAGAFTLLVEKAVGISCEQAQQLAAKVLYHPGGIAGYSCEGKGSILEGTFACSKGFDGFRFTTQAGTDSETNGSAEGADQGLTQPAPQAESKGSVGQIAIQAAPGKPPTMEPERLEISFGVHPLYIVHIHWQSWGGQMALGKGLVETLNCETACASGHYETQGPIEIKLAGADEACGQNLYRLINLRSAAISGAYRLACSGLAEVDSE